ncbi:MAG: M23 family metallopeptidase, partial [bacterium]
MKKTVLGLLLAVLPALAFNWPIAPTNQAHPLGNNWGEYQDYGGGAYFHNGIDIFPLSVGAPVYAVAHGWVKGWGTIQANLHYRLAISDSSMVNTGRCTGWLYAHIDPARPHKSVGEEVNAGDLIGYLVDFPYNFQHIHFARISDTGATWQRFPNYTWWFIQDPLTLLEPNNDTVVPTFENARTGSRFAYCRDNLATYLSPDSLYGNVDVIAKVHDRMTLSTGNTTWDRLAPFTLEYRIKGDWDSLPWRLALTYKYGLPPPGTPEIGVVYKDDATCNTRADYNYRDYFHIVTNTDGDSVIEATDSTGRWATASFHDGYYWVFVRAKDAAGNARVDSQRVRVVNGNPPLEVACFAVTSPPALCDTLDVIAPACSLVNNGPTAVTYNVRMRIGSTYNEFVSVNSHAPGQRRQVTFSNWTAQARGLNVIRCSTELTGDLLPANNRTLDTVTVLVHDAAAVAVTSPSGAVPPGPVQPQATLRNNGTQREPVRAWFVIGPAYRDSVNLAGGLPFADTTLAFAQWTATAGNWTARCSVAQAVDNVRANDTASAAFTVNAVDVSVEALVAPADTIDSVGLVTPMARLRNNGAGPASFTAWFSISGPGTDYRDSVAVTGLASGDTLTAWFEPWPEPRRSGWHAARCSVAIAFDGNP